MVCVSPSASPNPLDKAYRTVKLQVLPLIKLPEVQVSLSMLKRVWSSTEIVPISRVPRKRMVNCQVLLWSSGMPKKTQELGEMTRFPAGAPWSRTKTC